MNPCLNGGSCLNEIVENSISGYCSCKLGFTGKLCETQITCPANFYTDDCSVECEATDNCEIHQACDYFGRLKCKDGWGSFPACNTRLINPSIDYECPVVSGGNTSDASVPCLNGGSCYKSGCCCPPGFIGARCEKVVNQCYSSPCLNGATCLSNSNGFTCQCLNGYSGMFCQSLTDPCKDGNLQCSAAGLCIPFEDSAGFNCSCFDGYTGKFCETHTDYCVSDPCVNNSTCVALFKRYYCSCPLGFTGNNCETALNYCDSNPCVNGKCSVLVNDYVCNVSLFVQAYTELILRRN